MLLLDGDRVVVSVNGYLSCLSADSGDVLWHNPLKGEGIGLVSLASVRGGFGGALLAAADQAQSASG
jgi:outer membrane protein assembly factor BamB